MIANIKNAIAKKREESEEGFTLIELLVVILIIGVLAAIAIPVFLNQRQGAWEAQVESDIANAAIAIETYSLDHNGSYLDATTEILEADYGYNATPDVELEVEAEATAYTFTVTHLQLDGTTWTFTSETGRTVKTP